MGGGTGVWVDEWVHTSIDLCSFSVWRDPAFDKFRGGGPPVPPPLNPPLGVVVKLGMYTHAVNTAGSRDR